jgi:hypothetical protein
VLPAVGFPHLAPAGYRPIPALADGRRLEENAPAVGQPRDAQAIIESGEHKFASRVMSDGSDFLKTEPCLVSHLQGTSGPARALVSECRITSPATPTGPSVRSMVRHGRAHGRPAEKLPRYEIA